MYTERIQKAFEQNRGVPTKRAASKLRKHLLNKPIDAVTFDSVEITGQELDEENSSASLISLIQNMSDQEVSRRMKKHRNTYQTVEDALVEKLFMEAL